MAEHDALVTRAAGPVSSESFVIFLRSTAASEQENATYSTDLIFGVTPDFQQWDTLPL